jgi:myosin heavy subunit
MFTKGGYPMADSTYSVRIDDQLKDKISDLIKESGLNSKDFMATMVQNYEINKTKEVIPLLNQDLTELQTLTSRINNIYISIGERINTMSKAKDEEYKSILDKKTSLMDTLQDKISSLEELNTMFNTDVQHLQDANINLELENSKLKKQLQEDTDRLNQVNESNKALIEEYKDKIDTLSGIVEEYKGYKVEIEQVKKDLQETSKQKDLLENQNIKLNDSIQRLNTDLQLKEQSHGKEIKSMNAKHEEGIKSLQEKMELKKEKTILDLQKKHQEELQTLNEEYNAKVKALLNELEVSNKAMKKSDNEKNIE